MNYSLTKQSYFMPPTKNTQLISVLLAQNQITADCSAKKKSKKKQFRKITKNTKTSSIYASNHSNPTGNINRNYF